MFQLRFYFVFDGIETCKHLFYPPFQAGRCLRVNFVPIGPKCFEFVLVSLKNLTRLRAKELISLSKYTRIDLCKLNTFNFLGQF